MARRVFLLITVLILLSGMSRAADNPNITGSWTKIRFEENGSSNMDPRWSVDVTFRANGSFTWQSVIRMEEHAIPGGPSARTSEFERIELAGRFEQKGKTLTLTFTPKIGETARYHAENYLGYSAGSGKGRLEARINAGLLLLTSRGDKTRVLVFSRIESPDHSGSDPTPKDKGPGFPFLFLSARYLSSR